MPTGILYISFKFDSYASKWRYDMEKVKNIILILSGLAIIIFTLAQGFSYYPIQTTGFTFSSSSVTISAMFALGSILVLIPFKEKL